MGWEHRVFGWLVAFKFVGVILLLVGAYLGVEAFILTLTSDHVRPEVYALLAVFLAMMVRVLQAEKHRRDRQAE